MAQKVIGQYTGHHCFTHRHGADTDTRVMAAFGEDVRLMTRFIDRLAGGENRGGRLHCKTRDNRLAG